MKKTVLNILLVLAFSSCEKTISFDLDESEPKLVVEATIENNKAPYIVLSKSLNYFSQITPAILSESFVHNAEIYVSNGVLTHRLKEYTVPLDSSYTFYYYSIDSTNPGTAFTGQLNTRYSLRIVTDGKEFTANTTIPLITRKIDSLFWKQAPGNNDSSKVSVMIRATDQPGYGDYIRYFTKRNNEPFYPGINSVYDDQIIDGISYELQVDRGVNKNEEQKEGYVFFNKGDTVTLKLCNIDKATYDFWRTMEFTYSTIGNPFSSPTTVMSNISNGALGYFGGYAAQFRTIIIPQ